MYTTGYTIVRGYELLEPKRHQVEEKVTGEDYGEGLALFWNNAQGGEYWYVELWYCGQLELDWRTHRQEYE